MVYSIDPIERAQFHPPFDDMLITLIDPYKHLPILVFSCKYTLSQRILQFTEGMSYYLYTPIFETP